MNDTFSEMDYKHDNPLTSIDYARVNKSIIYVTTRKRKTDEQVTPQENTQ